MIFVCRLNSKHCPSNDVEYLKAELAMREHIELLLQTFTKHGVRFAD